MNCLDLKVNNATRHAPTFVLTPMVGFSSGPVAAQSAQIENLAPFTPGRTKAVNALWTENPLDVQFRSTNRVVVANSAPLLVLKQ